MSIAIHSTRFISAGTDATKVGFTRSNESIISSLRLTIPIADPCATNTCSSTTYSMTSHQYHWETKSTSPKQWDHGIYAKERIFVVISSPAMARSSLKGVNTLSDVGTYSKALHIANDILVRQHYSLTCINDIYNIHLQAFTCLWFSCCAGSVYDSRDVLFVWHVAGDRRISISSSDPPRCIWSQMIDDYIPLNRVLTITSGIEAQHILQGSNGVNIGFCATENMLCGNQ